MNRMIDEIRQTESEKRDNLVQAEREKVVALELSVEHLKEVRN